MPEPKSRFIDKILDGKGSGADEARSFTSERQHTAQAFNLHVERRDGRHSEGFAWSHYAGYQWTDEGDHEKLDDAPDQPRLSGGLGRFLRFSPHRGRRR